MSREAFDVLKFKIMGITDRDAPSLYGYVPERDLYKLWAEKTDLEDSTPSEDLSEAQTKALRAARTSLSEDIGKDIKFLRGWAESPAIPFLRAIVDAHNNDFFLRIVELSPELFAKACDETLPFTARIPERYWVEVQHQMAVLNHTSIYFTATIDGDQFQLVRIPRDPHFMGTHFPKCFEFWDHVRRGVPPEGAIIPPDTDPDAEEAAEPHTPPSPPVDQL